MLLSAQHWGAQSGRGTVPRDEAAEAAFGPGLTLPRGGMLLSDEIWAVRRARHKICSSWPHLAFWRGGGDRLLLEPFCSQICFLFTKTNTNSKTRSIPPSPFSHRVTQLSAPTRQSLTVIPGGLLGRTQGGLSQLEGLCPQTPEPHYLSSQPGLLLNFPQASVSSSVKGDQG